MKSIKPHIKQSIIDIAYNVYNYADKIITDMVANKIHKEYNLISQFIYNILE